MYRVLVRIMKEMRLVSGYDYLYGALKKFIKNSLFGRDVEIDSPNTMRNLSEVNACATIMNVFKKSINDLTVRDRGEVEIKNMISLKKTRPFITKEKSFIIPKKSVFNKIVGDSHLELEFANFLEHCDDVVSYTKNFFPINFKLDYIIYIVQSLRLCSWATPIMFNFLFLTYETGVNRMMPRSSSDYFFVIRLG